MSRKSNRYKQRLEIAKNELVNQRRYLAGHYTVDADRRYALKVVLPNGQAFDFPQCKVLAIGWSRMALEAEPTPRDEPIWVTQ